MSVYERVLEQTMANLVERLAGALPKLFAGLVVLLLAIVVVKVVLWLARRFLRRLYPGDQRLVADLLVTVLSIVLWFGVGLLVLSTVGLNQLSASLGAATGFIALGISYALSEMIEDTVAGVYLLRDPNFNVGDRVVTEAGTGTVSAIELRKSRLETDDGNVIVVANRTIEAEWTHAKTEEA